MKTTAVALALIAACLVVVAQPTPHREPGSSLFTVMKDDLYGCIDMTGKVRIPIKFEDGIGFSEGLAATRLSKKYGFIDTLGTTVIPFTFDFASGFHEGLAKVGIDGKVCFIDRQGKVVFRTDFQQFEVSDFSEGLCRACLDRDYCGYLDKSGKMALPLHYWQAGDFSDGLAAVTFYESFSVFSSGTLKQLEGYPDNYDKRLPPGSVRAWRGNKTSGYINKKGELVLHGNYQSVGPFSEGLALVKSDHGYGFIDKSGSVVIAPAFTVAGNFTEGRAAVIKDGKYGAIDNRGNMVIPNIYAFVGDFSEGLAVAEVNGLRGYIDHNGEFKIPAKYSRAFPFHHGRADVELEKRYYVINKKGEVVY